MKNVFIINAHQPYPFSEGKLNSALETLAEKNLGAKGYEIRKTASRAPYHVDEELEKHTWADAILLQSPVNWMGVPWSFKKYMDEVYSMGMAGQLCHGDGRSRNAPDKQYGSGGTLGETRYMLSLTFNAPRESFDDPSQDFFAGRSVDDLFLPTHLNFRFFGMKPMETFACHDVMKNPDIENDFRRFETHLDNHFPKLKLN